MKNRYRGENALLNYLNPKKGVPTPMVELPKELNPFAEDGVRIHAKLLQQLPLGNVKSIPAFGMLEALQKEGRLDGTHTIIENSSGNTVLSLSVIGRLFGIKTTKAFVSHEVTPGKLRLLQLFGVKAIVNKEAICPDPSDTTSGIYQAKQLGETPGWVNAGQYENTQNPASHEQVTGPEISDQLCGDIQLFAAGLGTTGTMVGTATYLKKYHKDVITVGSIRTPNSNVPGVRTRGLLHMIAFDWKNYVDHVEEVGTQDSFKASLKMIRLGLVVGPSSGFSLSGLLQFLQKRKDEGRLDELRNKSGEINAVFICCDSPLPYAEDYFTYLDSSFFPEIDGVELLLEQPHGAKKKSVTRVKELTCEEAFNMLYKSTKSNYGPSSKTQPYLVLDVRAKHQFDAYHLHGSINIEAEEFFNGGSKDLIDQMHDKEVCVICQIGVTSARVAEILQEHGVKACSIKGGLMEWSHLDLPRWKNLSCMSRK